VKMFKWSMWYIKNFDLIFCILVSIFYLSLGILFYLYAPERDTMEEQEVFVGREHRHFLGGLVCVGCRGPFPWGAVVDAVGRFFSVHDGCSDNRSLTNREIDKKTRKTEPLQPN